MYIILECRNVCLHWKRSTCIMKISTIFSLQKYMIPSVSIIFQPCVTCTERVPLALALAFMYNVDMLKERSVKWINKFFLKVWPTKNFASLPPDILQFCLSSAKQDLVCIIRRLKFVTLYEILLRLCASCIL